MSHTFLVTGGTGFIGRHTLAALSRRGHKLNLLMRSPDRLPALRQSVAELGGSAGQLEAIAGDLSRPGFGWSGDAPTGLSEVDRVIHLGGLFDWRLSAQEAHRVNTEGSRQLVEWCARQGAELVAVSGFMAHNPNHLRHLGIDPETGHADWPRVYTRAGAYEASKMEAHFETLALSREKGVPLTVVSPATVAGHSVTGDLPAQQPFAQLIRNLAAGRLRVVPGSRDHWLPLIAVDTLAELLSRVAEDSTVRGQSIVALDRRTPDLLTMLQYLARVMDAPLPRFRVPKALVDGLLRIPGMESLMGTPRETLDFIQPQRFDTSAAEDLMARHSLAWPDVEQVLAANGSAFRAASEAAKAPGQIRQA